jgi:hypothetical protein
VLQPRILRSRQLYLYQHPTGAVRRSDGGLSRGSDDHRQCQEDEEEIVRPGWYPGLLDPILPAGITVHGASVAKSDHGRCVRIDEEVERIAMDGIDLENQIAESTTRRTIVKTGAKLAYAVPVVAASFRLSQTSARAQAVISGFVCPPNLVCGVQQEPCGEDDTGVCSSVRSVEAESCICGNDACGPACSTDDDCQTYAPGSICQAPDTGCCGQTCIAPCHAFDGASGATRRSLKGSNSGE